MKQIAVQGLVRKLQTTVKERDDGAGLEALIRFSTTDIKAADLHRLFQAQAAGVLEFTISSPQLELLFSEDKELHGKE